MIMIFENVGYGVMKIIENKKLSAYVHHNIRTPLTIIKGNVDMLKIYTQAGQLTEEKLLETIDVIKSNIERLERFLKEL